MRNGFQVLACVGAFSILADSTVFAAPPAPANGDADAKIIETVRPQFPMTLQRQGVASGEVSLLLEVDPKGHLGDCLVTAYSHVEFSHEALRVAHAWKFVPARIAGQPVTAVLPVTIAFETNGMLTRVKQFDEPSRRERRLEYQAWNSQELDAPPKILWTVSPQYPEQLGQQGITGRVTLDFYVDETGRVRFPQARPPANPQLAALAIKAVKVWAFDPPIRHGIPVLARASTSFLFEP